MKVKVGVSNRHVHFSKEDFKLLFGDSDLPVLKELSQNGEFASSLVVDIKTDKNILKNVRLIGPFRDKTQVEISITDAYFLGLKPPVRMSKNFDGALDVILVNGDKELLCKNSCIIANRHIHINSEKQSEYGIYDGDEVSVLVSGERGGRLDKVLVKAKDNYNLELHLDMDEANAMGLKNGDEVEVIKGE